MSSTSEPEASRQAVARQAAERLVAAEHTGEPCAPVRDLVTGEDVALAYEVQRLVVRSRTDGGARVVGRKIGLTSPAVQQQLGVDRPDFGVLLDDMDVSALGDVPAGRLLQPQVEAEIAFVLGADLDDEEITVQMAAAAVDHAVAALEIVDSRIAGWDITITDTIADNASSGLFVLGTEPVPLSAFDPVGVTMRLLVDGVEVSTGNGAACLGNPLNALLWLARTAREYGEPLRAGQVVLSGALGPMVAVKPGSTVRAELSCLGSVGTTFALDNPEVSR